MQSGPGLTVVEQIGVPRGPLAKGVGKVLSTIYAPATIWTTQ